MMSIVSYDAVDIIAKILRASCSSCLQPGNIDSVISSDSHDSQKGRLVKEKD